MSAITVRAVMSTNRPQQQQVRKTSRSSDSLKPVLPSSRISKRERYAEFRRSPSSSIQQQQKKNMNMGNLALIDDTWMRMPEDAASDTLRLDAAMDAAMDADAGTDADAAVVQAKSLARIDEEHHFVGTRDHCSTTWTVRSPITLSYRVVEVPNLLDPANDGLLFGHMDAERARIARTEQQRRLVVVDAKVDMLYGARIRDYMDIRGVDYDVLTLPMVEEEKSIELMLKVCERMKTFNLDRRNEPVIAIGGGVCLDVVGLAASLFRRKTPYIRVPTTTLSYVDASVGAKTGVNFMGSKNRLGTYIPPVAALLDPSFIVTEDKRAIASGVSEMAKMALMKSPELFLLLEEHATSLVANKFQPRDENDMVAHDVLRLSIETMLEELAPNLWEESLDRLVDFGHTIGQELEMHALGTEHELTHGESVAVDMAYSSVLAYTRRHITRDELSRILFMLRGCQVPLYSPIVDEEFLDHAMKERVRQSMGQRLPLPVGIGKARLFNDVTRKEMINALKLWTSIMRVMSDTTIQETKSVGLRSR